MSAKNIIYLFMTLSRRMTSSSSPASVSVELKSLICGRFLSSALFSYRNGTRLVSEKIFIPLRTGNGEML